MKSFKVIEVKINEHDGDSYEYVSGIITDNVGNIKVTTCGDVLTAMRFNNWEVLDEHEKKLRNQLLELVKSYFPKKNHTISYRTVTINIT